MFMKIFVNEQYSKLKYEILNIVKSFEVGGEVLYKGSRNTLKIFTLSNGIRINVKEFGRPNFINRYVYRFIRPSKAERSFNNALFLLDKDVSTPAPVAYIEEITRFSVKKSYYVSIQLDQSYTFRRIIDAPCAFKDAQILVDLGRFYYKLHLHGIEFVDNTPGNLIIVEQEGNVVFNLVDLNRMNFRKNMSYFRRIKNISKLTPIPRLLEGIVKGYSLGYTAQSSDKIYEDTLKLAQLQSSGFEYKKALKKMLKFWKY